MKMQSVGGGKEALQVDGLLIPVFEDVGVEEPLKTLGDRSLLQIFSRLLDSERWKGERGELKTLASCGKELPQRLVLVGLGKRSEADFGILRQCMLKATRELRKFKGTSLGILVDGLEEEASLYESLIEGVLLGCYNPRLYKTSGDSQFLPDRLLLVRKNPIAPQPLEKMLFRAEVLTDAVNLARRLVNEPGNILGPVRFAEKALEVAEQAGLEVEVFDEEQLKALGMNAVLAVAAGSPTPARFVVLIHRGDPDPERAPIAFIGKGVTFDSGGISIKPSGGMDEMKMDKAGACGVLASLVAISKLGIRENVVGLIPLVENLPGNAAQRPGDVIRSLSGKTIEVLNTDAEGRLILADALAYAQQRFSARLMVDLATLTGACMVALGKIRAGFFANREDLALAFLESAHRSGEKFWRLPLDPEYRKELESSIADIRNIGGRWGGAITAAKFLEEFVADVPWCHVDMAGMDFFPLLGSDAGPSGFGVLTLTEFASAGA